MCLFFYVLKKKKRRRRKNKKKEEDKTTKGIFNALTTLLTNPDTLNHKLLRLASQNDTFKFGLAGILSEYTSEQLHLMNDKYYSKQNNFSKKKKTNLKRGTYQTANTDFKQEYLEFFRTVDENRNHRKDLTDIDLCFNSFVPRVITLAEFAYEHLY